MITLLFNTGYAKERRLAQRYGNELPAKASPLCLFTECKTIDNTYPMLKNIETID